MFSTVVALAQVPEADQYYINLPGQNPAFTGVDNFLDVQLRYRKTWSQFGSNPSILGFSVYGKIGKAGAGVYRNNSFRVSDPNIYASKSTSIARKHGFGASVNSFKINGYDRKSVSGKYAYHIPVSSHWALSMGVSFQLLTERFNADDLTVRDPINDQFYQSIMTNGNANSSSYSVAFGGALYSEGTFIGLGINSLLNKDLSTSLLHPVSAGPEFYLLAGQTFKAGPQFSLQPTARLSSNSLYGTHVGVGLRIRYKELISTGFNYEHAHKVSYLLGLNIKSKLRMYYAFDYFINDLKDFRVGNHEVIVRIPFFNQHSLNAYTW